MKFNVNNSFNIYYSFFFLSLIAIALTSDLMQRKLNIKLSLHNFNILVNPGQILEELENSAFRSELDECEDDFFGKNSTIVKDCSGFNNCNGHGTCQNGQCVCFPGWTNYDCSISNLKKLIF